MCVIIIMLYSILPIHGPHESHYPDFLQVCGTDGLTYENICILRSTSANTRLDYRGPCAGTTGETMEAICERVVGENRCAYNSTNCQFLVMPEDGCCPICGECCFDIGVRGYCTILRTLT